MEFDHADKGLHTADKLNGFDITALDAVFDPIRANYQTDQGICKSEKIAQPVAVRYGWSNRVKGSLFVTKLLQSVRTDHWENAKRNNQS